MVNKLWDQYTPGSHTLGYASKDQSAEKNLLEILGAGKAMLI